MSWLSSIGWVTPLYLAGLAAISLPIFFHLIRRTPRGQTMFSSLMFLSPSPPRLTRRSRIDNWLLLLLRALALTLIALAFARPFRRSDDQELVDGSLGRRVAVVVDTSASMRRDGVWEDVTRHIDEVLADIGPRDQVALFAFDTSVRPFLSFDDAAKMSPKQQVAAVRAQLESITPGWGASDVGSALIHVADVVDALQARKEADVDSKLQIILISDFQHGASIEALQGYKWPEPVQLDVRTVDPRQAGNAGLHLIADRERNDLAKQRLRIANSADSRTDQFTVGWKGETPVSVYVPPGKQKIIKIPARQDPKATDLVLQGDHETFDNTLYFAPIEQEEIEIVYLGDEHPKDSAGMLFYLHKIFFETRYRKTTLRQVKSDDKLDKLGLPHVKMVILTIEPNAQQLEQLQKFLNNGGHVLSVLGEPEQAQNLGKLTGVSFQAEEAKVDDYRLLATVDFDHPVFAPLLALKFTDFTQPHFWRYREVKFSDAQPKQPRVVVRFENDAPALVEFKVKTGILLMFTSGWNPDDSQFAVSKKFLPVMLMIVEYAMGRREEMTQFRVGEKISLPEQQGANPRLTTPDDRELKLATDATQFAATTQIGLYQFQSGDIKRRYAVNVDPKESDTLPMDVGVVERRGVRTGRQTTHAEENVRARQKRDKELERSQQFWRWMIVAAIVLLVVETGLAGHIVRKNRLVAAE